MNAERIITDAAVKVKHSRGTQNWLVLFRVAWNEEGLSVVRHTRELWQNGRNICPDFLYRTKDHLASFYEKTNGWWGDPFYMKFWINWPPLERNSRFWTDIRS